MQASRCQRHERFVPLTQDIRLGAIDTQHPLQAGIRGKWHDEQ